MDIISLFKYAVHNKASDIHITPGMPPILRIDGVLTTCSIKKINDDDIKNILKQLLDDARLEQLEKRGQTDTVYSILDIGRFRINVFKHNSMYGIAIRVIPFRVPTVDELGLPSIIKDLARLHRGLVLITGPSGSGKSTTLASIINQINEERRCHIITLEDPIEYLHEHKRSIVTQREVGMDTVSFSNGLSAALRQDPDVIMVGEMRDLETISIALTAAETGHLVLSTLHTIGAAKTVDRIIDVFPPHQQQQIRIQLSTVIQAVISQQLLPRVDGKGRIVASEVMIATTAIRNLIRENKAYQIDTVIQTGHIQGMKTMDQCLLELFNKGIISKETLLSKAVNSDYVRKMVL
mgnify:CR=1 FL=1